MEGKGINKREEVVTLQKLLSHLPIEKKKGGRARRYMELCCILLNLCLNGGSMKKCGKNAKKIRENGLNLWDFEKSQVCHDNGQGMGKKLLQVPKIL